MTFAASFASGSGLDAELEAEIDALAHAHLAVSLEVSRQFRTDGFVLLDGLWSDGLADALEAEVGSAEAAAIWPGSAPGPDSVASQNRAPARQVTVDAAPVLAAVHVALARVARVLTGRLVVSTVGNYGYYELDDACYLHVDVDAADVTFLIAAAGHLGPLHLHPELVGRAPPELHALESDPTWDRHSGELLSYPRSGVAAIDGRVLPHHRPGATVTGLNAVAALQYGAPF
jgi:hypothetical protein